MGRKFSRKGARLLKLAKEELVKVNVTIEEIQHFGEVKVSPTMEPPATQFCEIKGTNRTQGEKQVAFRSTALPTFRTEYIIIILNTSHQQV
jgi:hypothetical protein